MSRTLVGGLWVERTVFSHLFQEFNHVFSIYEFFHDVGGTIEHVDLQHFVRASKTLVAQSVPEGWVVAEGTRLRDVRSFCLTQDK